MKKADREMCGVFMPEISEIWMLAEAMEDGAEACSIVIAGLGVP